MPTSFSWILYPRSFSDIGVWNPSLSLYTVYIYTHHVHNILGREEAHCKYPWDCKSHFMRAGCNGNGQNGIKRVAWGCNWTFSTELTDVSKFPFYCKKV